jgi:CHASE3 domain sensor protein
MAIPIFWRLFLGYLLILIMAVAISSYSIVRLGGLSATAGTLSNTDNRLIADAEKLTDAFLSEVRYAGRFIITHSNALHHELGQFKNDFTRYMSEMNAIAPSEEIKSRLASVEQLHLRYHDLFNQEVRYIKANQAYAESRYQQERDKILETALKDLERLKAQLQKNLHDKLETMEKAARSTRTIAAGTTLVLLGLGFALSFVISKGITTPLSHLRQKTLEDPGQRSDSAPDFSHIPEIQALANALRAARANLEEIATRNREFVQSASEHLITPIISLKTRMHYLKNDLAEKANTDQRTTFEVLIEETERLIERCSELRPPAAVPFKTEQRRAEMAPDEIKKGAPLRTIFNRRVVSSKLKSALTSFAERGRNFVEPSWSAICQSVKTLGCGKAKKP